MFNPGSGPMALEARGGRVGPLPCCGFAVRMHSCKQLCI